MINPINADLILARAEVFAHETAHHTARRDHKASKALLRQWVQAKARLCALEVRVAA